MMAKGQPVLLAPSALCLAAQTPSASFALGAPRQFSAEETGLVGSWRRPQWEPVHSRPGPEAPGGHQPGLADTDLFSKPRRLLVRTVQRASQGGDSAPPVRSTYSVSRPSLPASQGLRAKGRRDTGSPKREGLKGRSKSYSPFKCKKSAKNQSI